MIAFAFTPAAMSRLANVCRHSCRPIESRSTRRHAVNARLRNRCRRKRLRRARAEDEASVSSRDELVLDEEIVQGGDDRDAATAGAALWSAGLAVAAHARLDADQSVGEFDVVPLEGPQLTAAQAGVERAGPERAALGAKGGDQGRRQRWRRANVPRRSALVAVDDAGRSRPFESAYVCLSDPASGKAVGRVSLQRDELADRGFAWPALEAHDEADVEGLCQSLECRDAGAVLAGLDSRDGRVACAHPLAELFLREAELGPAHDHEPGELDALDVRLDASYHGLDRICRRPSSGGRRLIAYA